MIKTSGNVLKKKIKQSMYIQVVMYYAHTTMNSVFIPTKLVMQDCMTPIAMIFHLILQCRRMEDIFIMLVTTITISLLYYLKYME